MRVPWPVSKSFSRIGWTVGLGVLALVGCTASEPAESVVAGDAPNLVIVLSDTLRAANLPHHGSPRDTAPRLRQLAAEGLIFRHHLANDPGPPISVSQILTGRLMPPLVGRHRLGPLLGLEVDVLEGGFVLSGLRLQRIGAPEDAATIDAEAEEQLRALGYVR